MLRSPDQSFWVKDEFVLACSSCGVKFSVTQRRHHCRACGEVFCGSCTTKTLALPFLNYPPKQQQRVCEVCYTKHTVAKVDLESYTPEKIIQLETLESLKRIYRASIKPLEIQFKFGSFSSPILTDADFDSKPMVLLIGQYSVGKTSFIRFLLGKDYPGQRIGPEPTTDQFVIVTGTKQTDNVIPGNALTVQTDKPFQTLKKFGSSFLNKLQCSETNTTQTATILDHLSFVDTPGVLSGEKQRIGRSYDYRGAVEWFASRCDRILLLFDAHKLDISDEFQSVIETLKGYDEKIRVILNKADMINSQQLLRVHGALMWSLGKVIKTPECIRVYVGSFWDNPSSNVELINLFKKESTDLLTDLNGLPHSAVIRKINNIVRRARAAKIHALLISTIKKKTPYFGRDKTILKILDNLDEVYGEISRSFGIPLSDFPDKEAFKKSFTKACNNDPSIFPNLNMKMINGIEDVLSASIPRLSAEHSKKMAENGVVNEDINPFEQVSGTQEVNYDTAIIPIQDENRHHNDNLWGLAKEDFKLYAEEFHLLNPIDDRLTGIEVKEQFGATGLSRRTLKKIWNLSDIDGDGALDILEFALAKHLIKEAQSSETGNDVPDTLPRSLIPPNKRHFILEK